MKKLTSLLLSGALTVGLLAGCAGGGASSTPAPETTTPAETAPAETASSEGAVTLKVGASPTPHAEILAVVKDLLAEEGITLEIVEFTDYIQPNLAVEEGEIDANYFQHITYLESFNEERGTHLVSAGSIHYEPLGIYPGKQSDLAAITDGAEIAVPNDTTNEARALLLLQEQGLITLNADAGINATVNDITDNPHNISFIELAAEQIPRSLPDFDFAVINGNYALQAGLNASTDALAVETSDSEAVQKYVNVVAVKEGNENSEGIQALVSVLKSDEIRQYIEDTYQGSVVPFEG